MSESRKSLEPLHTKLQIPNEGLPEMRLSDTGKIINEMEKYKLQPKEKHLQESGRRNNYCSS